MTFGEKLYQIRKANGMSQEEVAIQIAVSRQAVSKWELNSAKPDIENILQISKLFGVSTDYLLDDELQIDFSATGRETNNIEEKEIAKASQPKERVYTKLSISLIVLCIYMVAFAFAIMTNPLFLPFVGMIATAISILTVIIMTKERS